MVCIISLPSFPEDGLYFTMLFTPQAFAALGLTSLTEDHGVIIKQSQVLLQA